MKHEKAIMASTLSSNKRKIKSNVICICDHQSTKDKVPCTCVRSEKTSKPYIDKPR